MSTKPHNPQNVTDKQLNPDGRTFDPSLPLEERAWRFLDEDEIFAGEALDEIQMWRPVTKRWNDTHWRGSQSSITYRTRLTREELRAARGIEEPKADPADLNLLQATNWIYNKLLEKDRKIEALTKERDEVRSELKSALDQYGYAKQELAELKKPLTHKEQIALAFARDKDNVEFQQPQGDWTRAGSLNYLHTEPQLYRLKSQLTPEPNLRDWSRPEDVPMPVCWIREPFLKPAAFLVVAVGEQVIRIMGPTGPITMGFNEIHRFEYSTDGINFQPCKTK